MVLVILAILAAILVPALLGWIDEAKKKQTVLEARNVYIATQTIADEQYAKNEATSTTLTLDANDVKRIATIADVKDLTIHYVTYVGGGTNNHGNYTVDGMGITFTPANSSDPSYAKLEGDTWEVYDAETKVNTPPTGNEFFVKPSAAG